MIFTDASGALKSDAVRIRPLTEADLNHTLTWRNDDRSLKWFKSQQPLTEEGHFGWFRKFATNPGPDRMYFVETLDGLPVGQTSIYNFSEDGQLAEVGRFLSDPDVRGKGLFRDALILTLTDAFSEIGLPEVFLEVLDSNDRAIRVYHSVGFKDVSHADGMVRMSLNPQDFAATIRATK